LWLALLLGAPLAGASPPLDPALASSLAYHERPGVQVPLQLSFRDAHNEVRTLAQELHGLPVILIPGYFACPNLCSVVRASLFEALRADRLRAGRDYTLTVVSIDPRETSVDARRALARDRDAFDLPGAGEDWHYLTGSSDSIHAVADAVGFRALRDARSSQYLHPAGLVFLTPQGVVSSYLLGVGYTPVQVRAAIERAGAGRIAAAASPILLLCFHFDATTGRYSLQIMKLIRLGGVLTILTLGVLLWLLRRRPAEARP
jgi:protein SCO1/2